MYCNKVSSCRSALSMFWSLSWSILFFTFSDLAFVIASTTVACPQYELFTRKKRKTSNNSGVIDLLFRLSISPAIDHNLSNSEADPRIKLALMYGDDFCCFTFLRFLIVCCREPSFTKSWSESSISSDVRLFFRRLEHAFFSLSLSLLYWFHWIFTTPVSKNEFG